jgi:beta-glucosidase
MKRTTVVLLATLMIVLLPALGEAQESDVESRVEALIDRMTLEEKIGQLNQYSNTFDITGPPDEDRAGRARLANVRSGLVGSMLNFAGAEETRTAQRHAVENSRLGIPMMFGLDVIHGFRTMFPIPLGEAASWDLGAIERSARISATEASAAGIHWTFAPVVDIARDARWGRIMEGAGEDPFLASRIADARVRGFQGEDLASIDTVAACAKHFAAYGFAEAGREYNTVEISENTLRNVVLPPFRAAVSAGVATVMNGFNEIGGVPVTASSHLQRDILKGEWGFEGFVVSDWDSIGELTVHGVAADRRHAAAMALVAGSDMDMQSGAYLEHLADLVREGAVSEDLIDDAVRRILAIKFRLGLFDDPYRYCDPRREQRVILSREHLDAARDVARRSIVLLKNDGELLPLDKRRGSIAVIGALAADKDTPLGSWRARAIPNSAVSLLEGIRAAVGDQVDVTYAEGAPLVVGERSFLRELEFNTEDTSGFAEAVAAAEAADVVVIAVGEEAFQSGEARSQVDIRLKGVQQELLEEMHAANPNLVVVLMNGRPLVLDRVAANAPAILETWHLGSEAGNAIADVLFGDYNPSGRLPVSFPHHVGQEPLYYNQKNTGRPQRRGDVFWSHYTDAPNGALYPFGYGLSYTNFEYSDVALSDDSLEIGGELTVDVTVENTGKRAGTEVVQLYVRDLVASVTRPVKELKGFQLVELEPGARRSVRFTLTAGDLSFHTARGRWEAEPGEFAVYVGRDSEDLQQRRFVLKAEDTTSPPDGAENAEDESNTLDPMTSEYHE